MQAVVKTPRIEIAIRGEIPPRLLTVLEVGFGDQIQFHAEEDDERVDVFETAWYTNVKAKITSGENLKIYRQNHGLTQVQLGDMLGGLSRRHISNLEHNTHPISSDLAQKSSRLFDVSFEKFTS